MKIQYVLTKEEIKTAKERLIHLQHIALLSRDAEDYDSNREYYLRAKGFEEALIMLGILPK